MAEFIKVTTTGGQEFVIFKQHIVSVNNLTAHDGAIISTSNGLNIQTEISYSHLLVLLGVDKSTKVRSTNSK